MPHNLISETLLVGAGPIAIEYARILKKMERNFSVAGRGQKSADAFHAALGVLPVLGLDRYQSLRPKAPHSAIVSVNVEQLAPVTESLLKYGVKRLLVEKPAGLNIGEIRALAEKANAADAEVYVAYNRRHYASVRAARQLIAEDGGVQSFNFEFTEWTHEISKLPFPAEVKQNWFLANSSHVVDMAFYLGGKPAELYALAAGEGQIDWHAGSAIYAGAGRSENGALFSYQANWTSAGRWGVEILTRKRRFIFRPLEKLQVQLLGSVAISEVKIDDAADKEFKPGFYFQLEEFFKDKPELLSLPEQIDHLAYYERMVKE